MEHQKLDVYQASLQFIALIQPIQQRFPQGRGGLADQLSRAALSISLNIAEGAGEFAPNEKARFYRIARRSAAECAAVLDVACVLGLTRDADVEPGREILTRIFAMLTKMAKNHEGTPKKSGPA